ncbi:MAG TPA: diaminopropionate ammonia-lyase, partial [Vicinamibacteria bacterium]|nr:diaminopropionate ammonia-lyase [Vicinamibacteria bacterium]
YRNPRTIRRREPRFCSCDPIAFHRRLPGYEPTPLVDAPTIAERLGLARLTVKDESCRFGLPSFKLLGASWAIYRALVQRHGELEPWSSLEDISEKLSHLEPLTLAAATDGNHGRAVAHMARLLGFGARVFVPAGTAAARIRAIEAEGAEVEIVDGDYDATIRRSAREESRRCLVVDDTSWPGYEEIPRWVIEGYSTIFWEIDAQLDEAPNAVFVPLGVGALGAAAADFFASSERVRVIGVEPASAACVQASLRAGQIVTIPGPHPSIMVGLNCGTPSSIAFPALQEGLDACIAVADVDAEEAMRALAASGIVSGETGAASLAGLQAVPREQLSLGASSSVVVLCTEGATDPESYERIVGRSLPR